MAEEKHNEKVGARGDAGMIAGETDVPVGAVTGEFPAEQAAPKPQASTSKFAFLVGAGILLSRIVGVIRQRVFAHYFGTSAAADAFNAAFRIPNFLQNIFGEGALSASFIPVYAGLLARGDERRGRPRRGGHSDAARARDFRHRAGRRPDDALPD